MQVGADCPLIAGTLEPVRPVVASAHNDAPQRLDASPQIRLPAMVLEADRRSLLAVDVVYDQQVTDHARLAGKRVGVEQTGARDFGALAGAEKSSQQLVAAAHCQQRCASFDRLLDRFSIPGQ